MSDGTYTYTSWDEKVSSKVDDGPSTATAAVTFVYNGVIKGEGKADLLMFYGADGFGTFIGYEQVVGTVDGRSGSFVWRHEGTYDANGIKDTIEVVPGSGTGELAGFGGTCFAEAVAGQTDVPYSLTSR